MTDLNPCHPAEQQARQDRLEAAYLESGRTNGVYTGLLTTPEPAPVPEATTAEEAVPSETITIPRAAFDDMREWIETGLDLDWWHENDDHREDQPETWELAQRGAKHLWLGDFVAPASEEAA